MGWEAKWQGLQFKRRTPPRNGAMANAQTVHDIVGNQIYLATQHDLSAGTIWASHAGSLETLGGTGTTSVKFKVKMPPFTTHVGFSVSLASTDSLTNIPTSANPEVSFIESLLGDRVSTRVTLDVQSLDQIQTGNFTHLQTREDDEVANTPRALRVCEVSDGEQTIEIEMEMVDAEVYSAYYRVLPPRSNLVTSTIETWATKKIEGDLTRDVEALGALTDIDTSSSHWSLVMAIDNVASATGFRRIASTYNSSSVRSQIQHNGGNAWYGVVYSTTTSHSSIKADTETLTDDDVTLVVLEFDRDGEQHRIHATHGDNTTITSTWTSHATRPSGAEDLYLLSLKGAVQGDVGLVWAAAVEGTPTSTQREDLLAGTPPWDVLGGANVLRAYNMADTYEDGGSSYVPDRAEANGGPYAAVTAELRNATSADLVTL